MTDEAWGGDGGGCGKLKLEKRTEARNEMVSRVCLFQFDNRGETNQPIGPAGVIRVSGKTSEGLAIFQSPVWASQVMITLKRP